MNARKSPYQDDRLRHQDEKFVNSHHKARMSRDRRRDDGAGDDAEPRYICKRCCKPLAERAPEERNPTMRSNLILSSVVVLYFVFILFAAFIFNLLERDQHEVGHPLQFNVTKKWFVGNHTCLNESTFETFMKEADDAKSKGARLYGNTTRFSHKEWTLANAFLLAFTAASTIGYGVLTPSTPGGQIFCIFFSLLGIPFTAMLAARLGFVMAFYIREGATKICGFVPKAKIVGILFTSIFGIVFYVIAPTVLLLFVGNDKNWTVVQCLYCVVITLTTIGFGDYVPDPVTQGGMQVIFMVMVWVIAGLAWFAAIINLISVAITKKANTLRRKVTKVPIFKNIARAVPKRGAWRNQSCRVDVVDHRNRGRCSQRRREESLTSKQHAHNDDNAARTPPDSRQSMTAS